MTDTARAQNDGPIWTGDLDYALPHELIAQQPATERTDSRLMVVDRGSTVIAVSYTHLTLPTILRV